MTERRPFDPQRPYDALADHARARMAYLGAELMADPRYARMQADPKEQYEALLIGILSGVAGVALAQIKPEGHADVRAALLALIPYAVDNARNILDLPPLEPLQ
ncbi:hypothetical protein [Nitratireductor pacificus]|uniref:Uncharacterized protein n=1 Tax=Nitratireductor pacificus pht-3B TaxID=391937 RepID=K2MIV9_9HYPH|nr:hypothetical protein [Nitratireductor pacificus]EKF17097.1 hypothetical protein NA2_20043 [Nitratireductor pacificus pht-3B]